MIKSIAATLGVFGLLSATSVVAQAQLQSLEPKAPYSAHRAFSDGEIRMDGAYHYTPGKHRSEMQIADQSMIAIIREDLDVMWSLSEAPEQGRFYMELSLDSKEARNGNSWVDSDVVESRLLGAEKIDGHRTHKYEVTVREPRGETFSGTIWVTDDVIPVRMEMRDPRGRRLVVEQTEIEIGPQPDELFEITSGYAKIDLGLLGAANGSASRGLSRGEDIDAGDQANDFAREVADHAAEAAKQGVLQGVGQGVRDKVGRRIRGLFQRGE